MVDIAELSLTDVCLSVYDNIGILLADSISLFIEVSMFWISILEDVASICSF